MDLATLIGLFGAFVFIFKIDKPDDLIAQIVTMVDSELYRKRMRVVGMADTTPIVDNKTPEERSRNRRVEISIVQGKPYYSDEVSTSKQ